MVQTIKSVLLIDYDSVYDSLDAAAPGTGDLLGSRAGVWLEAIESGAIVDAAGEDEVRRRFQTKRCYASPQVVGKNRGWLTANGMHVIDCTAPAGLLRGAGDIHLVLDALDAVEAEPDEIILLTAETDLTPLLFRLRALNLRLLIFGREDTAASYRTFADGFIDQGRMIEALTRPAEASVIADKGSIPRPPRIDAPRREPAPRREARPSARSAEPPPPVSAPQPRAATAAPRQQIDREAMAALVRRVHEATNVPLFSPRAFADLFDCLANEIRENGYKFQSNADHVAAAMNKAGRNVTKRQVGFVIKGLTLRGHIFTSEDTAETLAGTFYEQVLYLVSNAKMDLSEDEKDLLESWIVGTRPERAAPAVEAPPVEPAPVETPSAPVQRTRPRRSAERSPEEEMEPRVAPAARPAPRRAEPRGPMRAASRPARVADTSPQRDDLGAGRSFASRVGRNGAATPRPRRPAEPEPRIEPESDLEDSILSAIADAVDVLADDDRDDGMPDVEQRRREEPDPEPDTERREADVDDEIGDEIQRILASYGDRR